jgi:hypothetical protein
MEILRLKTSLADILDFEIPEYWIISSLSLLSFQHFCRTFACYSESCMH